MIAYPPKFTEYDARMTTLHLDMAIGYAKLGWDEESKRHYNEAKSALEFHGIVRKKDVQAVLRLTREEIKRVKEVK